ncbi:hypothetical protein SLS60_010107 [Paraconiothyrium brasiliense]|uniref:Lysine-specific metallo-endopeptidase domain-containing protein n=1 Tax=Paraconiothyrium brasiliense TaxID=300254 RepID=A0ABR3QQB9_9PLEO
MFYRPSLTTESAPDLVKRVDADPSAYPYGTAITNEFSWSGWDPNDTGTQRDDGVKIHNAYDDMLNMIYFAWQEANAKSDTFKRWFDESDSGNVVKVLERMFNPSGVGQATELMKDWILLRNDDYNKCGTNTRNAYSAWQRGFFHICPKGIAQPNMRDLKCTDIDGFASQKMKSVAFSMLHEATHWKEVGDAALGSHIKDTANGAYDCFNLQGPDKLLNAQNYAYLGAEAYMLRKQCTFTDPPPGTAGTEDTDDEVEDEPMPTPSPSPEPTPTPTPPPYNPGTCCFHLTETELPCLANDNNLRGIIRLLDDKKEVIGETDTSNGGPGERMDDGNSYHFKSKLHNELVITGEHQNDYVQFTIGGLSWASNAPNGGGECSVGGWDPRQGSSCGIFGTTTAVKNMDCCFPCDGST